MPYHDVKQSETVTAHSDLGLPLVTCVMPTRNRPELALQAIGYFLRQDYPRCELVVVDDGFERLPALPEGGRVRYLRLPPGMSLGAKRNFGCSQARGSILVQWDDDDWHGQARLTRQTLPLLRGDADVTAISAELELELDAGVLRRAAAETAIHPRTLAFPRDLWEQAGGYPDQDLEEDSHLLHALLRRGARLTTVPQAGLFFYVRHREAIRRLLGADPPNTVDSVLGEPFLPPEDRAFYAARSRAGQAPLVSCIMPTADRRELVENAIRQFLAQDYAERELVIVDDGRDAVADLIPSDPRFRYLRIPPGSSLGAKRNLACREAGGELIAHWDDDDWMASWRLRYQIERLLADDADVCGLGSLYFWEPVRDEAWLYDYPNPTWIAGGTMLYRRSLWRRNPFQDVAIGEDNLFLWSDAPKKVLRLEDPRFYVAVVHARNSSPKTITPDLWHPRPAAEIRALMGEDGARLVELIPNRPEPPLPAAPAMSRAPGAARARPDPLVSCILATKDRPRFVRQAIRCFLRQTYRNAELVVVDNGEESVEELCSGLLAVRYLRAPSEMTLGAKLNLGIEHARGSVLQKLDDDDYYHPLFQEHAVISLLEGGPECGVAAWDGFLILLAGQRHLRFSGPGWLAGGTLCFHRATWEQTPFRDLPHTVDSVFLDDLRTGVRRVHAPELYLLVRHGQNTWRRLGQGTASDPPVDEYFRTLPGCGMTLAEVVEPIDIPFYEGLMLGESA